MHFFGTRVAVSHSVCVLGFQMSQTILLASEERACIQNNKAFDFTPPHTAVSKGWPWAIIRKLDIFLFTKARSGGDMV